MDPDVEGVYLEIFPTTNQNLEKDQSLNDIESSHPVPTFYIAQYPKSEESSLEIKIAQAERVVFNLYLAAIRNREGPRRSPNIIEEQTRVRSKLKALLSREKRLRMLIQFKTKEINRWEMSHERNYSVRSIIREIVSDLCSSEQELYHLTCSLRHRMQHQSKTLVKEKRIVNEIKDINGTREKVLANAKLKERGAKLLNDNNLDRIIMEKDAISREIKVLQLQLKGMDTTIAPSLSYENLGALEDLRIEACRNLVKLQRQRDNAEK